MAASQTGLSSSVSASKTDLQSEDVKETKEDQKTLTQAVETKVHGSESTHHENPEQDSQDANMLEKKETGLKENLTGKDNEETPVQIDVVEPKSLSEVHDTKASIDHGCDDSKVVGDIDNKTKSDGACGTIKQAENPETKIGLSLEATKDNSEEVTRDTESKATKEANVDTNKIPADNPSGKEVVEDPKDSPAVISDIETQSDKKANVEKDTETSGDKRGEGTAPDKDDDKKSVTADENAVSKGAEDISKDAGEAAVTKGEPMETAEKKEAEKVADVADDKDNVCAKKDDKTAANKTEGTEHTKEGKNEAGKEPDTEPEEPAVPKMPNGVASKGKGRRKGNPKRAVPDDTPEPSTSAVETKSARAQPAKKESAQPPSKKRKGSEEPRSQPTRRSKRRKFHGWGAKRKTRASRAQ